jgi:hypothetical protein
MKFDALGSTDPAPIPAVWVVTIKGLGLLLAIAALIGALRSAFERGRSEGDRNTTRYWPDVTESWIQLDRM